MRVHGIVKLTTDNNMLPKPRMNLTYMCIDVGRKPCEQQIPQEGHPRLNVTKAWKP